MDFDSISVFVKVVQAGSFSQAARILRMPNSTVSAKVSGLEKKLGVTLLQRTTRNLRVTQAGEAYFTRCVQALEHLEAGENELATTLRKPHGLLRVTASVAVGHCVLPAVIREFVAAYPEVEVEIVVNNRVVDLIAEGVDLAIRAGKLKDSRLIAKKFVPGYFTLWASPSYLKTVKGPAHPKDLGQFECLTSSRWSGKTIELWNGTEKATVPVSGKVAADDLETIKKFTALGYGIGLLPDIICQQEAADGKLVKVLPHWRGKPSTLYFVYPAQAFVPAKVRAFISTAEKTFRSGKAGLSRVSSPAALDARPGASPGRSVRRGSRESARADPS
jgi:DNA-binding transcriptional LysR family regulator